MSTEILSTLLQASGAAGVTLMFVFYLTKRDKRDETMIENFNKTISDYLKESVKVKQELSARIQEFSDTNKELRTALEHLYVFNKDQRDKLREYEEADSRAKSKQRLRTAI